MEKESQRDDFWQDQETAKETSQMISSLKEEISKAEEIGKELQDLKGLESLAKEDSSIAGDLEKKKTEFIKKLEKEEIKTFFSGKYDQNSAILEIFSGAGGVDAQDWATMLLRMYERYCQRRGFNTKILHQSFGEPGGPDGRIGIKSVTMEVVGKYAYGFLKKESGVHRLVRISPFSAQKLRHTSFALIGVLPILGKKDEGEVNIKPEDLKIETFKSSGPGGQYVNKRESAIRITHLPTGIVVSSQAERLQGANRDNAMKVLRAKLHQLQKEEQEKEISKVKGKKISASWGNQIRSYVLHPYQLVKDLRTGVETSSTDKVLDGDLDEFIEAEIKLI